MTSENDTNIFEDSEATILYTKLEDKNPLTEIMERMTGLSLASISPKKQDISVGDITSDLSIHEDNNKSEDVVYLKYFVETIRNLQKKFKKIIKNKFVHKSALNEIYAKLQHGDQEGVKNSFLNILDKKTINLINQNEIYNFIQNTFPMFFKDILENLDNLSALKQKIFESNKTILEKYHENNVELIKMTEDLNNKIKLFKNNTKSIFSFSESDNINGFFHNLTDKVKELYKQNVDLKLENKKIKENPEIEELIKQLEDKKLTIKQLQSQNVSFSEVITKLDTSNIKLKKECVILGNEYRKVVDSLKTKNTIIEKQKKILEILQNQIGTKKDFPIDELKKKIEKLKCKIDKENVYEKILKLKKEKEDYEKRVKDYETIHK